MTDNSTTVTLREFLRIVAEHPAQDDPRLSAPTLREILRDFADHARRLHGELQDE